MEIGGDYHWFGLPDGPYILWKEPFVCFGLGRNSIIAVWKNKQKKRLFIPAYFCEEVVSFWEKAGIKILRYDDDPTRKEPNWNISGLKPDDMILIVNYFGVRNGPFCQNWRKQNPDIIIIEDHSHDPFSNWAVNSNADYAFASVRKIFPLPDGAILWSPLNHPLPAEPSDQNCLGSAFKLAAMIWKKEYIDKNESNSEIKDTFRKFQIEGEKNLSVCMNNGISPWSKELISKGYPVKWREQRQNNARLLLNLIEENNYFQPVFSEWPQGNCPLNIVLNFNSHKLREIFRYKLISNGIYTPIHWDLTHNAYHSVDFSKRILSIPIDQRYDAEDMHRIAAIINKINCSHS